MIKKEMNSNRKEKIASKVRILAAEILRDNFREDPIISGVSLVGAQSHGGLRYVKLFYYTRHDDKNLVRKRLVEITKMVRFELAQRIDQKYVPDIRFAYDDTLEKAARIDELLAKLN
ncbi:MAG: ribosome-binding factor A [Rickettsiales bacterium]|jgi:ribosome-binding factor A|nr:ribosome-binding factor A [Rickettsiales bacterium]